MKEPSKGHSDPAASEEKDSRRRSRNHPRFLSSQVLKISARFTDCSCHSSPQFLAPAFSHSVYLASGSQAYFLVLVVLNSQVGPALHLPPLLYPAALAPREVYPVSPSCWWRLASLRFCCVRLSCEKRDSSSVALLLPELPKSLLGHARTSAPSRSPEEEIE